MPTLPSVAFPGRTAFAFHIHLNQARCDFLAGAPRGNFTAAAIWRKSALMAQTVRLPIDPALLSAKHFH